MRHDLQAGFGAWSVSIPPIAVTLGSAVFYLRGWFRLRRTSAGPIPSWRAGSFLLGLFLIWVALGSPLAAFDEELLTVHMVQHVLLMTIAPALILAGAPMMPMLHGLPRAFVHKVVAPVFRCSTAQRFARSLTQPAVCWITASAVLVGWHIPAAFTLGLQSEGWHVVEHLSFLGAGLLFWWPVVQPWPSLPVWPQWALLLYLFAATLPCDVLSGFLVFSDRVVYPIYFTNQQHFAISTLADQECAGALMWTCITIIYRVPATLVTTRLLGVQNGQAKEFVQPRQLPE